MEAFETLNEQSAVEVKTGDAEKKAKQAQKTAQMNDLLKDTIKNDPTFVAKLKSLSTNLAVVKSLGFGDSGNIVLDKENSTKDDRKVIPTSAIVGYRVQNTGSEPVKYLTEEFTKNAEGVFVGNKVEKVLAPGAAADFTRKYMTIFASMPEVSFTFANGAIVRGAASVKPGDLDGELEAYYFSFADKEIKVNSDEIKLNVGQKVKSEEGTDKWIVKPDFEAVFGYLNNAKAAKKGGRTKSENKFTTRDASANYINRLLKGQGTL